MNKKTIIYSLSGLAVAVIVIVIVLLSMNNNKTTTNVTSTSNKVPASHTSSAKSNVTAINNSVVITKNSSQVGSYLAKPNGYALYTYSSDKPGISNCSSTCLSLWPAYVDSGSTSNLPANFGTIKRTDNGQIQYTYKGMPLYTYVNDKTGQVTGNGVAGFTVARP